MISFISTGSTIPRPDWPWRRTRSEHSAFRPKPDSGEAHLARAVHLYRGYLDYDGALAELEVARQTLPNHARIFQLTGSIQRRQGHWEESRRNLERAAELDPRNTTHARDAFVRLRAVSPLCGSKDMANPRSSCRRTRRYLYETSSSGVGTGWNADTATIASGNRFAFGRQILPLEHLHIAHDWLFCALAERDGAAATQALSALNENEISVRAIRFNSIVAFVEGVIARMTNDERKAQLAFAAARAEQEKIVEAQPDYGPAWCVLGMIDAGLGRKEEALREGRRALELLPVEKEALSRTVSHVRYFAMIAAWVGEKDLACEQLAVVVRPPSNVSYGELKLMPWWDPLRGDPCFEKIVASLAPK